MLAAQNVTQYTDLKIVGSMKTMVKVSKKCMYVELTMTDESDI